MLRPRRGHGELEPQRRDISAAPRPRTPGVPLRPADEGPPPEDPAVLVCSRHAIPALDGAERLGGGGASWAFGQAARARPSVVGVAGAYRSKYGV